MIIYIATATIAILIIIAVIYYNKFITLTNQIDNSLSQIDVQLKKRSDLIPSLISTIKGFVKHEKKIMTEVTDARKALLGSKGIANKMQAGNQLQSALGSLFAIAENYPDLKSNQNFLQMQQELSAIEDKIAYARQYYNDGIMTYNVMTNKIPGIWFAKIYNFAPKEYLKIPEIAKVVPKIEF